MTAFVFVGPTLPAEEARRELDAVVLPPAAQGDVYRVSHGRPRAIGLIDGYFESQPAVWHKEILWALAQGIRVYGSASMGALRAVELAPFGMVGVGEIFRAFREGELEDDDEVALVHGAAESGYRPLSEPMVNLRATLLRAEKEGMLSPAEREALVACTKARPYAERSFERLVEDAREAGLDERAARLGEWLREHRVDRKRADALAMLRRMRRDLVNGDGAPRVGFTFEYTHFWHRSRFVDHVLGSDRGVRASSPVAAVLEEAALVGDVPVARRTALLRALALAEADRQGIEASEDRILATGARFRAERGLAAAEELRRWLAENDLDRDGFVRLMREEAAVGAVGDLMEGEAARGLLDALRLGGRYGLLAARAAEKTATLLAHGLDQAELETTGCSEVELFSWFFERHLRAPVPVDVEAYARSGGFPDATALRRAVVREWHYVRRHSGESPGAPEGTGAAPGAAEVPRPEVGDPAPPFALRDVRGETVALEDLAGRAALLLFLPADPGRRVVDLATALAERFAAGGAQLLTVSAEEPAARPLAAVPGLHLIDAGRVVAGRYGCSSRSTVRGFLLDPALRIRWIGDVAAAADVPGDGAAAPSPPAAEGVERLHAPVLIVPGAFDAATCRQLVELWHTGGHEKTGVSVHTEQGVRTVLDDRSKQRRDHLIRPGPLEDRLSALIDRRIRPELARSFHHRAGPCEQMRVGRYAAEEGGFFRPHRDDAMVGSKRQFSLAINLNVGEYEGGLLRFPESGGRTYQPETGAALVFSASLIHEVTEVTSGTRFVFLTRFLRPD